MADWQLRTPVAFLVFRRPDTTARVFAAIREARPPVLLVVADGPRRERPGERDAVAAVRRIVDGVDWPCEVLRYYSDVNLGCRRRVSSGLDWVFSTVEEAIILEDDCLPHPTFFRFCQQLLERYRADERVMQISGTNRLVQWKPEGQSYHFSYYGSIWGWASWSRAWRFYDVSMRSWAVPEVQESVSHALVDQEQFRARRLLFDQTFAGRIDTWDYQWSLARLSQSGLSIVPAVNLVSNIGFGPDAVHTRVRSHPDAGLPSRPSHFPLVHPPAVVVDRDYDRRVFARQQACSFGGCRPVGRIKHIARLLYHKMDRAVSALSREHQSAGL